MATFPTTLTSPRFPIDPDGAIGNDIARGGSIAGLLQQRYGLCPAMGAMR